MILLRALGISTKLLGKNKIVKFLSTSPIEGSQNNFEEIKIPVPWGHISGKWWGDKNIIPVLAIHGWQDNANTFDKLLPLLNVPAVLAIDLPGHGFSSHLPEGKTYTFWEYVISLHRIIKHFQWPCVPLLTHSLGGAIGFAYSSIFSEQIKWFVNFECARCALTLYANNPSTSFSKAIDNAIKIEKQKKDSPPPAYRWCDLLLLCIQGSMGSINSLEAADTLLKRGTVMASQDFIKISTPETGSDLKTLLALGNEEAKKHSIEDKEKFKEFYQNMINSVEKLKENIKNTYKINNLDEYYIFTRDPLIKVQAFQSFNKEFIIEASKHIKCPCLSIRARNGFIQASRKWWHSKNKNFVLCIHGWQDNANTFDTLIPLLPQEFDYLAIDLPGHGLSSHIPKGVFYNSIEAVGALRRIQAHFKWSKFSLIGHSYGAILSFMFTACFPTVIDFYVAIDSLKPISCNAEKEHKKASKKIEGMLLYDSFTPDSTPLYEKDDLLQKYIKSSHDSITEMSGEILMERGTEEMNGLFKPKRDSKVKNSIGFNFSHEENLRLANSIKCDVLFLKAKNSTFFENKELVFDVMDVLKKKTKRFEYHELPGTHHLHLNTPEIVAPIMTSFMKTVNHI